MSYYMGDYYRGDYYRGDPGIGSFFKKALGFGASFIPGVGGLVGKAISALPAPVRRAGAAAGAAIVKHPVLSAAGAAGAMGATGIVAGEMMARPGGTMSMAAPGARPHGACYKYKPSKRHLHALAMGLARARPRMNPTNARALRRALRRAYAFERIAMRTIKLVHPRKKGRFGGFKRGKRR